MNHEGLVFVPLGGAGEIGLNVYLYGCDGEWIMVDLGLTFADEHLPGVDIVLPDIRFAEELGKKLKGIVLTHAHEDHIGALPHLWERLRAPIYCRRFTAAVLRKKLKEAKLLGQASVHEVEPGNDFKLGPFDLRFLHVTHSVLEAAALRLKTPHGTVLHTGDYKLDPNPLLGPTTDEAGLRAIGDEGVLALVGDSTNIFDEGRSGSEADVRDSLVELFKQQNGRILFTTFASNVARLESAIVAAQEAGRAYAVVGRSMKRMIECAQEAGYLKDLPEPLPEKLIDATPRESLVILSTGCQGEARAALSRMAQGNHPAVEVEPGDTVVFSSKIIPGNERALYNLHNMLVAQGVEVVTEEDHFVHVSGHPCRDEVAEMYRWLRPEIAVPMHGETRHLREHAQFAKLHGAKASFQLANGDLLRLAPGAPEVYDDVRTGRQVIESGEWIAADDDLFRTRRRLSSNGAVFVSLVMDDAGSLVADPKISAFGAVSLERVQGGAEKLVNTVADEIEGMEDWEAEDDDRVAELVRATLRRQLRIDRDKRPVVDVQLTRLSQDVLSQLFEESGAVG